MIEVTVGSTTNRKKVLYSGDTTLRAILEDNGIDYGYATVMLDGANIGAADMDRTLSGLGKTEKAMLIAVVKSDNA
jgi:hypothetical protein